MKKSKLGLETLAVHAGEGPCEATGALDTPVYMSNTFVAGSTDELAARFTEEKPGYVYTRYSNPTIKALEEKVAALEGGEAAVAMASGMAAISSVILGFVGAEDHVVASRSIYGASYNFINEKLPRLGAEGTFVGSNEVAEFEKAIRPNTKLIYFETPSNPVLEIMDIEALARLDPALLPYAQICDASTEPADTSRTGLFSDARDGRRLLGDGDLPVREFVATLPAGIPLSLEIRSRQLRDDCPESTERAARVHANAVDYLAASTTG